MSRREYYPGFNRMYASVKEVEEETDDAYDDDFVPEAMDDEEDGGDDVEDVVVDDDEYSDDDDFDQTVLNAIQRDKETKEREAEERERKRLVAQLEAQEAQAHAIGALAPMGMEGAVESKNTANAQRSPRFRPGSGRSARPSSASRMRPKSASRHRPVRASLRASGRPNAAAGGKHGRPESARRSRPDAVARMHDSQGDLPVARLSPAAPGHAGAALRREVRCEFRPASSAERQIDRPTSAGGGRHRSAGDGGRGRPYIGAPKADGRAARAREIDGGRDQVGDAAAGGCRDREHSPADDLSASAADGNAATVAAGATACQSAGSSGQTKRQPNRRTTADRGGQSSRAKKGKRTSRNRPTSRGGNVERERANAGKANAAMPAKPSTGKRDKHAGVTRRAQPCSTRPAGGNVSGKKWGKSKRKQQMYGPGERTEPKASKTTCVAQRGRSAASKLSRQDATRKRRALVCHNMQGKTSRASRRQQREREELASVRKNVKARALHRRDLKARRPHTAPPERAGTRQVLRTVLRRQRQKLRKQIRRERELAWNCSNPITSRGIPEYDPRSDQHCRWMSTPGVQKLIATSYANALSTDPRAVASTTAQRRDGTRRTHRLHGKFQAHMDAQDMLQLAVDRTPTPPAKKPLRKVRGKEVPHHVGGAKSLRGNVAPGSPQSRGRDGFTYTEGSISTNTAVAAETEQLRTHSNAEDAKAGGAVMPRDWAASPFFEEARRQVEESAGTRNNYLAPKEVEEEQFNNLYMAVHNPGQLRGAFLSAKGQLEALWEELDFPRDERERLAAAYFNTSPRGAVNPAHYASVLAEITRLLQYRTLVLQLLRCICQRENLVQKLKKILCDNDSATMAKLNLRYSRKAVAAAMNQMAAVRELDKDIWGMIKWWRSALAWNEEFVFNGEDYMVKMKRDLHYMEIGGCS